MPIDTTCNRGCGDDVFGDAPSREPDIPFGHYDAIRDALDTRGAQGRTLAALVREHEALRNADGSCDCGCEARPFAADDSAWFAAERRQFGGREGAHEPEYDDQPDAIEMRPHGADMTVHIAENGRQIGLIIRQPQRAAYALSKGLRRATGYNHEHASPGDFRGVLEDALAAGAFEPGDWERRMAGRTMSGMASGMES